MPEPFGPPRGAPAGVGHAYVVLRIGFTVLPIAAGLDKFANALVDWERYLAPIVPVRLGLEASLVMRGVGVIEVLAGLLVAVMPRVGGYVVMVWLWAMAADLLILGRYLDVALRDLGLSLGALALGRLGQGLWEARRVW